MSSYDFNERRTLQGSAASNETVRIDLDNGDYRDGWRVVYFTAWSQDQMKAPASGNCNVYATDDNQPDDDCGKSSWLASAWYCTSTDGGSKLTGPWMEGRWAEDRIVQEDLWITGSTNGDTGVYCFLIEIERVRMTPNQGLFQRSQASAMGTLE